MTVDDKFKELGFKKSYQKDGSIEYSRNDEYIKFRLDENRVCCFGYILKNRMELELITSQKMLEIRKAIDKEKKSWFEEGLKKINADFGKKIESDIKSYKLGIKSYKSGFLIPDNFNEVVVKTKQSFYKKMNDKKEDKK